jgi:hypothetical protein
MNLFNMSEKKTMLYQEALIRYQSEHIFNLNYENKNKLSPSGF